MFIEFIEFVELIEMVRLIITLRMNSLHFMKSALGGSSRKHEILKARNLTCFFRVFALSCFRD